MQWILCRERTRSMHPESVSRFSQEVIDRVTHIAAIASVDGYLVATMAVVHAEERQTLVGLGGLGGLALYSGLDVGRG
jgi:hypothetical protein